MKKSILSILTIALIVSLAIMLAACGGGAPAETPEEPEPAAEEQAAEPVELMGISKYSRTELGMLMEYDVSNHQVNENGQITQFDLHRTKLEPVRDGAMLIEDVDSEDSTITFEYDASGNIISARTDIQDYGYTMYDMTYQNGLIDTIAFSTDWAGFESPYKLHYTYTESEGAVTKRDTERLEGTKSAYPYEYEYNDNSDVVSILMNPGTDYSAEATIEYDANGYVTKITNTNKDGPFLIREFEYTSLGNVGNPDMVKTGFLKWQEFSIMEEALRNCF